MTSPSPAHRAADTLSWEPQTHANHHLQNEAWFQQVVQERTAAMIAFEAAVEDRDVFQQELGHLVAEWGEDRAQRDRELHDALQASKQVTATAERESLQAARADFERAAPGRAEKAAELSQEAEAMEAMKRAVERSKTEKIMLQRQVEVLGASVAREMASKERAKAAYQQTKRDAMEQVEESRRLLARSQDARLDAEREVRRLTLEVSALKRGSREGPSTSGERGGSVVERGREAVYRERQALQEELEGLRKIRQGPLGGGEGEQREGLPYKDELIHRLLVENEQALHGAKASKQLLEFSYRQEAPDPARAAGREAGREEASGGRAVGQVPEGRRSTGEDLLRRMNGALLGTAGAAGQGGGGGVGGGRRGHEKEEWQGAVMLVKELEPEHRAAAAAMAAAAVGTQAPRENLPHGRAVDKHRSMLVLAESTQRHNAAASGAGGITQRQMGLLREYFRKAARRSGARGGDSTVGVKGELGLLCTTVVYHLGLDPVPTDEVERRVHQLRREEGQGMLRVGEEHFMAWFTKEFVIAQDSLNKSRYSGDPVWERASGLGQG